MCDWLRRSALLFIAFLLAGPAPAAAQTIEVQNGGTLQVENGGVWDLNGSTLNLGPAGTNASITETGGGRFAGGELTATRNLSAPSQANPAGLGIEITASKDLGEVTVTRGHTAQMGNGNSSIKRFYDISPSKNNSGLSATLTHHYNDEELNGLSEPKLELFKSTDGGSNWSEEGYDSRDATANAVMLGAVESLSRWTLGSEDKPLPVEMAAFEARAEGKEALLQWQTAAETNNAGFEVQHKGPAESASWSKIGYVESKASGGTTTDSHSYRFRAEGLSVGTHRFRLRQVDLSGSATKTDPVTTTIRMQKALRLTPPAPNPVSGAATLRFGVKKAQSVEVALYDVLGRRMQTLFQGRPEAGQMQRVRLRATDLPAGTYFLRLQARKKTRTRRITVMR